MKSLQLQLFQTIKRLLKKSLKKDFPTHNFTNYPNPKHLENFTFQNK